MKRTARFVLSAVVCAAVLMFVVPQTSQAGTYPTNGCVSKKTKAAGKFCQGVLKAWSKWHKNPANDPVGTDRDAKILSAGDKLADAWTKAEGQSAKKNADCVEITGTSTEVRSGIETAIDTLQGTFGTSVDDADQKCRSKVLGAAAKFCSGLLGNEAKFIKNPAKDPDRTKLDADSTDDANAFTAAYDSNDDACTTPVPPSGDAVTAIDGLRDYLKEYTRTSPHAPLNFTEVIPATTVRYQGEDLHPICQKGTPYSFFYKKGTTNKLLMYYQGGGACWSNATCWTIGTSKETAGAGDNPDLVGTGFADPDNMLNIFKDWNVVFVSYCTGDVHWGDNVQGYSGGAIYHRGRQNAAVAEKWAREHFIDPDFVFVTGSSAGSYGAISNSAFLMKYVYPQTEFGVLGDAGIGVVTQPWLETYQDGDPDYAGRVWNIQKNLPTFIPGIAEPVSDLSLGGFLSSLAAAFPNNRFASYESAYDGGDGGQTSFYHIMKSGPNVLNWPSWWTDQCEWTACMREFTATISGASPNYRFYTGAGSRHTIYGSDKVYTDTTGLVPPITFRDWVDAMINDDVGWVNLDCQDGGDCDPVSTCQGGDNAGLPCTTNAECPNGGQCQHDPDPNQGPYSGGSVTCAPMVCPCGGTGVNCP